MNSPELCIAPHKKRADICSIGFSINLNAMIRRFTFLLTFSLATYNVYGQYEPMAIEGAHWVVFDKDDDGTYHHMLKIKGDTTVNGEPFKKLYRREIQSSATLLQDFLPPYYYTGAAQLIGLIRDDVPTEAVYGVFFTTLFSECNIGEEELVHDFSLAIGSHLTGCLHEDQGIPFAGVDSLKSEFVWGKQRKVQYVSTGYRFVEGVGGNAGPFSTSATTVPGILTEVVEYCIGTDAECGLEPVGTKDTNVSQLRIYPNPVDECLKIEIGNDCTRSIHIRLSDATGRVIREAVLNCSGSRILSVQTNGMDSGIYFLNIQSGNRVSSHKILVR